MIMCEPLINIGGNTTRQQLFHELYGDVIPKLMEAFQAISG